MSSTFLFALGNHLWQSTVVVAFAGLLAMMLRKHGGHVRYWVWFTASVKFLIPFSLLIGLGSAVKWRSAPPTASYASVAIVATEIAQPFVVSTPSAIKPSPVGTMYQYVPTTLFISWLVGFLIVVALWARSWWRMRAIIRGSFPFVIAPNIHAMASPALLEPSVFGIFRPVLLVPADIQERLSEEQLSSVVAHEMCHIRRRDNLLSSIHMTAAAIFWFYPVVWWLGSRLLEERERACDEQVVRQGSDPQAYAEGILRVCRSYLESPLRCVSGVSGANLQRRIEAIISGGVVHKLKLGKVLLLTVSAVAALVIPFAVGMVRAFPMLPVQGEQATADRFEVISVKPIPPQPVGGRGGVGRVCNGNPQVEPARFAASGTTAYTLITWAYGINCGNAETHNFISGEPGWVESDLFEVQGVIPSGTSTYTVRQLRTGEAPRLQSMIRNFLQDRFKLKAHSESRDMSVYALVVNKGGPKLKPFGGCVEPEPPFPHPTGQQRPGGAAPVAAGEVCSYGVGVDPRSLKLSVGGTGLTLEQFAQFLTFALDRPVIDKTGISGVFDVHVESSLAGTRTAQLVIEHPPLDVNPGLVAEPAPSIFDAIQDQLGLRLESTKGPVPILVIDSIDRPTAN